MPDELDGLVATSAEIPGWTLKDDARAVAEASYGLAGNPTIVEIGVFMGRCTLLLAGARKLKGSGTVHCVDPFDCSGDEFSIPHYKKELDTSGLDRLDLVFYRNLMRYGLEDIVDIHQVRSEVAVLNWTRPIDLLLLDGDQSPAGARAAFEAWVPMLKPGGIIILRNTKDKVYADGHDGHRRLAVEALVPPQFINKRQVNATTLAVKA